MSGTRLFIVCFTLAILIVSVFAACATTSTVPEPEVSFTPAKYTNDEYGFYVLYPDTMIIGKATSEGSVLDAAEPATVPSIGVAIDTGDVDENTVAALTALGGTKIVKVSEDATTLADGKTAATLTKRTWEIGGYPIVTLTLTVEKGGNNIAFSYSNIDAMMDEEAAKEVLYTLTFTK
ncbi:MAG: hypothetical protein JXA46_17125 [Dehalococcoidales bacterium]|nr:hypothetical protein [Dehalococcoidales bacterium]